LLPAERPLRRSKQHDAKHGDPKEPRIGSLTINNITVTGSNAADFTQTNNCGTSFAANATCSVTVTFKPKAKGSRSATLKFSDNAQSSTQTVSLAGKGN